MVYGLLCVVCWALPVLPFLGFFFEFRGSRPKELSRPFIASKRELAKPPDVALGNDKRPESRGFKKSAEIGHGSSAPVSLH